MSKPNNFHTREEWLNFVSDELRPHYKKLSYPIPAKVRFGIGFMATGYRSKHIGECWDVKASADKHIEIFISPSQDDAKKVAGILAHELVHAAVGNEHGHKAPFKRACTALGLEGKPTSASPSKAMYADVLAPILASAGPLPHKQLRGNIKRKKQGTRLLKVWCEHKGCGYIARVTGKWLEAAGAPFCGVKSHGRMECEELEEGGDE